MQTRSELHSVISRIQSLANNSHHGGDVQASTTPEDRAWSIQSTLFHGRHSCLPSVFGGNVYGDAWTSFMGSMDKEQSFKLMDAYYDAGGNFIDTANNYQNEQSEQWLGEWMKKRDNRDRLVLATKFTTGYNEYKLGRNATVNNTGNHKKSLHMSLRDSLVKLQTDYIDILYVHWWDFTTSIEEVMDSLHMLVQQGKILYLGISDAPAYIVAACNTYAKAYGKTQFSIYQGRWNIASRDMERDIVPMCQHFGMAIAPWDAIGGGKFQTKKAMEERKKNNENLRNFFGTGQSEEQVKMSEALEVVAKEHGIESVTAIALAYLIAKDPHVFPIIGGRKIEHLIDNIQALKIKLTAKQVDYLESVVPFDRGFPWNFATMLPNVINVQPIFPGMRT